MFSLISRILLLNALLNVLIFLMMQEMIEKQRIKF